MGAGAVVALNAMRNDEDEPDGIKCPHCGKFIPYEYDAIDWWDVFRFICILAGIAVVVWIIGTLVQWLVLPVSDPPPTLVAVLQDQWHWLKSIRVW